MSTTMLDGRTIAFEDTGTGSPAILVVHGFGGTRHHFDAEVAALRTAHRVVAIDRSGHGESDPDPDGYAIGRVAAELHELCIDLGLDRVLVVSHSFDKPSIELAARHPELVSGLVILDGPTVPSPEFTTASQAFADGFGGTEWRAAIRTFADQWVFPAGLPEADRQAVVAMVAGTGREVLAATWQAFIEHDATPAIRALACPVLYVAGTFPCDLDVLRTMIADLEIVEIRGRGHMLTMSAADEVSALIANFATRLTNRAAHASVAGRKINRRAGSSR